MIKSIIFTGKPDKYSWNGTVSESADAKFNRWSEDHPEVIIKGINYGFENKTHSICVAYEEPDDYKEHPNVLENGIYFIDIHNGRFIMCNRNIDVSYMVKNFMGFSDLMINEGEASCVAEMNDGVFIRMWVGKTSKVVADNPVEREKALRMRLDASVVIHERFIPGYGTAGDISGCFSISKNTGKYLIDISKGKLIYTENMLDVSYIVSNFNMFGTALGIDSDEDFVICMGDTFVRPKPDADQSVFNKDKSHFQLCCKEVIHKAYL